MIPVQDTIWHLHKPIMMGWQSINSLAQRNCNEKPIILKLISRVDIFSICREIVFDKKPQNRTINKSKWSR